MDLLLIGSNSSPATPGFFNQNKNFNSQNRLVKKKSSPTDDEGPVAFLSFQFKKNTSQNSLRKNFSKNSLAQNSLSSPPPKPQKKRQSSSGSHTGSIDRDSIDLPSDFPSEGEDPSDEKMMVVEDNMTSPKKASDQPAVKGSSQDEEEQKDEVPQIERVSGSDSSNIINNWLIN